jgi:hypothetical protein
MNYEKCESKVANLLASLDNLPSSDVNARFRVLEAVLAIQEKEIQELKKAVDAALTRFSKSLRQTGGSFVEKEKV